MQYPFNATTIQKENKKYLNIDLTPSLTGEQVNFQVLLPEKCLPLIFYTATTGMIETIGNMIGNDKATGWAFNNAKHIFKKINNPFKLKNKERVYITEHIKLDGHPEYIVTKHRISKGQNNFLNVGYVDGDNKIVRLILDLITGANRWLT